MEIKIKADDGRGKGGGTGGGGGGGLTHWHIYTAELVIESRGFDFR